MVEDIGKLIRSRFAFRTAGLTIHDHRRLRHLTYSHIILLQNRRTIVVEEGNLILRRRILFPSSTVGSIAGNRCNSRIPYQSMTNLSRYVLADRHLVMREQMTLYLIATFVGEDDSVFTRLLAVGGRISHIRSNLTQLRRPSCEIIGIVNIRLTCRVLTQIFRLRTIGHAILHFFRFTGIRIIGIRSDSIAIPVEPGDSKALLCPMMFLGVRTRIIPIIIGIVIGVDTMVEVIFLLYLPPLAVFLNQYKETTSTVFITIGMVIVSDHYLIGTIPCRVNRHVLSRLRIIGRLAAYDLLHEARIFRYLHGSPLVIDIAIGCICQRAFRFHKRTVRILQFRRGTEFKSIDSLRAS